MRIEFVPKHRAKIMSIEPMSDKRGQTDLVPAVALVLRQTLSTDKLDLLDKTLRGFLYKRPKKSDQPPLDGVAPASTHSELTDAANAIGAFGWDGEQTGSKLHIYYGIGDYPLVTLVDGIVNKVKATPKEGAWDIEYRFYSASGIDEEVMGHLGVMKNLEVDVEMTAAEIADKQPDLLEKKDTRQTPEQALAAVLGQDA